jgi:hypothetical protein
VTTARTPNAARSQRKGSDFPSTIQATATPHETATNPNQHFSSTGRE